MKQKKMQERLQARQRAWEAMPGPRMDTKPRSRYAAGGYRRPGSSKQSG